MPKKPEKIAVFAKNHQGYLDEAVSRNAEQPERFTTFRSSKSWATAHAANAAHGTLLIYFAPVGGKKGVEYTGLLHQVHLNPSSDDPVTKEVMASELDSTRAEGLWEDSVKTLYVVSHCERLARPFPLSALIKANNRTPLSDDFKYSYAVVREETALHMPFELHPEEIEEPAKYFEGATRQVSVNVYERNAAARKVCLNYYGCVCAVCEFDFSVVYGEIGEGFIHVHHLRSMSTITDKYEVDPVKDLRPVCPNCHAMLHRMEPPISIERLREIVRSRS